MTLNPQVDEDTDRGVFDGSVVAIEGGRVTSAREHTAGDDIGHHVQVRPYTMTESVPASVAVGQHGDTTIPEEGSRVLVGYRRDGMAVVLASEYGEDDDVPSFEPGERRVGHPASDSHVHFHTDGSIDVVGANGNSIELAEDGTVAVNGGDTNPVVDIEVETTEDADGHVTDVSLSVTRATDVLVPTNTS